MGATLPADNATTAAIAVIGAGLMGHGIAQIFAASGHGVSLHDPDPKILGAAKDRIAAIFGRGHTMVVRARRA